MNRIEQRREIITASRARVSALRFGEQVTNICASKDNPWRHCLFVEYKNRRLARCTDGKGSFGDFDIDVIHPGWLTVEESKELFEPVWQAEYGGQDKVNA